MPSRLTLLELWTSWWWSSQTRATKAARSMVPVCDPIHFIYRAVVKKATFDAPKVQNTVPPVTLTQCALASTPTSATRTALCRSMSMVRHVRLALQLYLSPFLLPMQSLLSHLWRSPYLPQMSWCPSACSLAHTAKPTSLWRAQEAVSSPCLPECNTYTHTQL